MRVPIHPGGVGVGRETPLRDSPPRAGRQALAVEMPAKTLLFLRRQLRARPRAFILVRNLCFPVVLTPIARLRQRISRCVCCRLRCRTSTTANGWVVPVNVPVLPAAAALERVKILIVVAVPVRIVRETSFCQVHLVVGTLGSGIQIPLQNPLIFEFLMRLPAIRSVSNLCFPIPLASSRWRCQRISRCVCLRVCLRWFGLSANRWIVLVSALGAASGGVSIKIRGATLATPRATYPTPLIKLPSTPERRVRARAADARDLTDLTVRVCQFTLT